MTPDCDCGACCDTCGHDETCWRSIYTADTTPDDCFNEDAYDL